MSLVSDSNLDSEDDSSTTDTEDANSQSESEYDTDDELDSTPLPAPLDEAHAGANEGPGQLDVQEFSNRSQSSYLPLCMVLNARSLYNKMRISKNYCIKLGLILQ